MSASAKRPPILPIAAATVAVTAIVYLVFLRGGSLTQAAKVEAGPPGSATHDSPPGKDARNEEKRLSPFVAPQQDSALAGIRDLVAAEKWIEARGAIAKVFATELSDAQRTELAALAPRVQERILSASGSPDVEIYEIQAGDSLTKIAQKFKHLKGCYGAIMILNGFTEPGTTLRIGRKIRIPKGAWSVVVDKSLFTLWVCYEGAPIREYRVAIGREEKTPAAVFTVGNKNPKPAWYPPQEMIPELRKEGVPIPIPYGHAKNPLGEYWIAIDHKEYSGLGIHGTNDPASIGTRASNGCVRMDNREVLMVAWTVAPGTVVTIVE